MLDFELVFSLASLLAMGGWVSLLVSPLIPDWSERIAGLIVPLILSVGYLVLLLFFPSNGDGGFGSLAGVTMLFSHEEAVLAGWIHYLAFDLLIGAWICRKARSEKVSFWFVVPCLPLTFMFGPVGYLAFNLLRFVANYKSRESQPLSV